jgi:eukaryotic-like serine/threonine-protein kinase
MSDEHEEGTETELDQALLEFMRRFDAGKIEDRAAFLLEYPEIAPQLRALLDAADLIESMAGPTLAELANPSTRPGPPLEQSSKLSFSEHPDPNALTLPPSPSSNTGSGRPVSISPNDSTLPPPRNQSDFSLTSLGNTSNSQSMLPYRFGDYILEQVLGRGGMGVVYLAFQVQLERRVAIKMIRSGCLASDDEVNRFHTEARSAASLDHPNIVTVYQCGECDGHHYFSMDYVPGTDLAKRLTTGSMSPRDAVRYVRDVARAIDYAHQQGVVHRDLKPANVLIDESDVVVVTDFGLAKQMGSDKGLTATGATLGTPSYMSPEQAAGNSEEQGASTDVYAIGAILYALLTGKPPFQAESVLQTIMQVIHRPAPTVRQSNPNVHSDLDTIVTKCLEKLPSRRYATAGELADDLDRFYQGIPITALPPSVFRRCKHWLANVPLIAAVTGTRNIEPTRSQRIAQNVVMLSMITLAMVWFTGGQIAEYFRNANMPSNISIASGAPGGMYYEVAGKLAKRLQASSGSEPHVLATNGSIENLKQLVDRRVQLALMQESSVRADQVAVVAPLFYEAVHILVPSDSKIEHIADLVGKKIMMGTKDSGTYQTATRLLKHFDVTPENTKLVDSDWTHTDRLAEADVVIAVTKEGQQGIAELLKEANYRLLSIDNAASLALKEPMFRLYEIPSQAYGTSAEKQIFTLRTTALLVVRKDASTRMVEECLRAIYGPPAADGLIALELAANWQGLPYHEAARKFFSASLGSP